MMKQLYPGVDEDENAGLTHLGRMVRDAWVFGILPESETCAGWDGSQMQNLYEQVYREWERYAHLPSKLPDELRLKHEKIYAEAILLARKKGWDSDIQDEE